MAYSSTVQTNELRARWTAIEGVRDRGVPARGRDLGEPPRSDGGAGSAGARRWQDARFDAFYQHNRREALAILDALAAEGPLSPLAADTRALIAGWERLEA